MISISTVWLFLHRVAAVLGMCSKGYMQTSFKNKINPRYLIYLIHPEGLKIYICIFNNKGSRKP